MNGDEITVAELNEEARARGIDISGNAAAPNQLLAELVDRKLLVQEALRERMDRSPQHLLASRRMNEILLSQALITSAAEDATAQQEPREFIDSRPHAFARRAMLTVEVLSFSPVGDAELSRALNRASSLAEAERLLERAGINRSRTNEVWDSASLDPSWAERITGAPSGRPVVLRAPDRTVVVRVLAIAPQPVPEGQEARFAREMMKAVQRDKTLASYLERVRSGAKITYQPEFAPRTAN